MRLLAVHTAQSQEIERLKPFFSNQNRLYHWIEYSDALDLSVKIVDHLNGQQLELLEISAHGESQSCDSISMATLEQYAKPLAKLSVAANFKILLSSCHSGVKTMSLNSIAGEFARSSGHEVWGAKGYLWYTLAEEESGVTESDNTLRRPYIKQENNPDDVRFPRQYDPEKIWRKFQPTPLALQSRNKIDTMLFPSVATRFRVHRFGGVAAPSDQKSQEILELIATELTSKTSQQMDLSRVAPSANFEISFERQKIVLDLLNRENVIRWQRENEPDLYWPASSGWREIVNSLFCLSPPDMGFVENDTE